VDIALDTNRKGTTDVAARYRRSDQAVRRRVLQRDPTALVDLIADDCVMEGAQPAPNGTRYEGSAREGGPPILKEATAGRKLSPGRDV
jgi:hypothetical protein